MGGDDDPTSNLVWLEHSKAWARVPKAEPRRKDNAPQKRRKQEQTRKPTSPEHSGDNIDIGGGDGGEIICSICLDEVTTYHKAVITPCMHEFHHTCIAKWHTMKQDCPLCKSQVHSVLYNIQDDGSFLERELNLPLKHVSNREDIMRRLAEILGEGLHDLVRSQLGRQREQQQRQQQRTSNLERRRNTPRGRAHPSPTPYSLRVQHHSNARTTHAPPDGYQYQSFQNYRGSGGGGGGSGSNRGRGEQEAEEEEALIAWRREIYDLDLYAIPLGTHHHVPRSLVAPAGRQNRIKEWVHRELQALLDTEHTTILRGFVMGLLATYGAHPPLPPSRLPPAEILAMNEAASRGREGENASQDDPVSQLRPFLGAAAGHFWHELSCFATAPAYTIRTYDSIVRYARPGEPSVRRRDRDRDYGREDLEDRREERRGERRRGRESSREAERDRARSRQRKCSYSRSRSPSRSRRRRHEPDKDEEVELRRRQQGGRTTRATEEVEQQTEQQTENSRWVMWKWGDPIYE